MADLVTMKSKTTFQNARIVGPAGGLVNEGDTFKTDVAYAKDLDRLGHAEAVDVSLDGLDPGVPDRHFQVSERALRPSRASGDQRRAADARARADNEVERHRQRAETARIAADAEIEGHRQRVETARHEADEAVAAHAARTAVAQTEAEAARLAASVGSQGG